MATKKAIKEQSGSKSTEFRLFKAKSTEELDKLIQEMMQEPEKIVSSVLEQVEKVEPNR